MSEYYSEEKMKTLLDECEKYRDMLYRRGFLISDCEDININEYPFYSLWERTELTERVSVYTHHLNQVFVLNDHDTAHFLIGHAYNPFSMKENENDVLHELADALSEGWKEYWKKESELTGIFCVGYVDSDGVFFSTDCTGMQTVYYGKTSEHFYISSHSKLIADLCGFERDDYITRLVSSRYSKYFGTWLPGDLSPFREVIRAVPNFEVKYNLTAKRFTGKRYYPLEKVQEIKPEEFDDKIKSIAEVIHNNMVLIARKWPDKKAAISVTGGKDSTTTLACANGLYDQFSYFSYISNEGEKVDAEAAKTICDAIGIDHVTYHIPEESELYDDIDSIKMVFECNAGCIGHNNENDIRKRVFLEKHKNFDVEVKSWVNEICRGWYITKFGNKIFPSRPYPALIRCMWKVITDPRLIHESNQVIQTYLDRYYSEKVFSRLSWLTLYYWEYSWGGGEGLFLTSEHKFSYEITIPYNNRELLNMMLSIPEELRIPDEIPDHVQELMNNRIRNLNISVHNISHTKMWTLIQRMYVDIFSLQRY